uniref:dolichyl-phosphate-mannose--protein mannosyltransferase n=1 Tax=Ciona savignyi TaxID=51511 RepID=H2ZKD6_CIOSA
MISAEILVCGITAVLIYWNTLDAEFVYDDMKAIVNNPDVTQATPFSNLFLDDFWGTPLAHTGSHRSYRPITTLTFRLNHFLFGMNPAAFHATNVLLHCVVTMLFCCVLKVLLKFNSQMTLLAGLIFSLHPVHTEAVAGVVGRTDILATFFTLAGTPKTFYILFATTIGFSLCALLSKEQGYIALPLCVVYDMWIHHSLGITSCLSTMFGRKRMRRRIWTLVVFFLTSMILRLLLPVLLSGGGDISPGFSESDNPAASSESFRCRALTFNYLLSFNLKLLIAPTTLSFDWSMNSIPLIQHWSDVRNIKTLIFYIILTATTYSCWFELRRRDSNKSMSNNRFQNYKHSRRNNLSNQTVSTRQSTDSLFYNVQQSPSLFYRSMAILLFLSLLLSSNLMVYVGFVVAERVLYLPSVATCILITEGVFYISSRFGDFFIRRKFKSMFIWILTSVLLASYALKTWSRNQDWKNEFNLYRSGISTNPAKAYGNLGNVLRTQGNLNDAEEAYVTALRHRSNMADVHYNLGLLYQDTNRLHQAEKSYRNAILFRPQLALASLNLGVVLSQLDRVEESKTIYRRTAKLSDLGLKDPRSHAHAQVSALYNLGCLLADEGDHVAAILAYQQALDRRHTAYRSHSLLNMLGQSLLQLGKTTEAERNFKLSLAEKPDHVPSHLTYARLLENVGKADMAEKFYLRALKIEPRNPLIHQHYSRLFMNQRRFPEAAKLLDRAVDATEGAAGYELLFAAASAHRHAKSYSKAELYYRMALATSHMNLGAMLHLRGKLAEARNSYLDALKLKPGEPMMLENLEKLETSLRKSKE